MSKEFAHLKVPLESIISATDNFAQENVISTGHFGKRYKGQLLWSGELIDINAKRLNKESKDGEQLLWTEISMLSNLKHRNVVSLVGFCDENDEKIIINRNETARGMLDKYVSDPMLLTWVRRLEISVGLAHALSYIHYDEAHDFSVIHRKISSYTVLLNYEWEPKLCDFEFSVKIKASQRHNSFHTNRVKGVYGYADPTYIETKRVSHKSDMYSFGIVLFELLCGRESISEHPDNKYLATLAIFHYKNKILDEIIDPVLWKQMDPQSFNVFAQTAYDCLNEERSQRPDIHEIVTRLESALKLQMEHLENSIVAAKVEDASSNHDKGSLTSISTTHVESHVNKKTKSFLKDLSHLKLSGRDIQSATNNFAQENIIRKFRFGIILKGRLLHSEQFIDIIVKRFYREYVKDESKRFWTEVLMLSSLKHKNLINLIGFYEDVNNKMIIYKKEVNESLAKYLGDQTLTWMQRLKICVAVGKALSYIHYDPERDFSVIHCNIMSSNILLDDEWEPKLSGFELSLKNTVPRRHRLLLTRDVIDNIYLDPKYKKTGGVTHKSDVYSFGVVLLEVLCGRSAVNEDELEEGLLSLLQKSHLDDIVDPHLQKQMEPESIEIFLDTAYYCVQEERAKRPHIDQVVNRLEKALQLQWKRENPVDRKSSNRLKRVWFGLVCFLFALSSMVIVCLLGCLCAFVVLHALMLLLSALMLLLSAGPLGLFRLVCSALVISFLCALCDFCSIAVCMASRHCRMFAILVCLLLLALPATVFVCLLCAFVLCVVASPSSCLAWGPVAWADWGWERQATGWRRGCAGGEGGIVRSEVEGQGGSVGGGERCGEGERARNGLRGRRGGGWGRERE
ncbi:kinase-like domain, phloem protein 2-like protein [Tanacetum coccineum]